jgi:hypothetical protein
MMGREGEAGGEGGEEEGGGMKKVRTFSLSAAPKPPR